MDRKILWEVLKKRGINEYIFILIEKIKETYGKINCRVKVGERMSEYFWTKRGVRQGFLLSPTLFNLYIADLAEEIGKGPGGVKVGRELIVSTEYADDGVIGEKGRKLKSNDEGIGELNKEVTAKRGEVERWYLRKEGGGKK